MNQNASSPTTMPPTSGPYPYIQHAIGGLAIGSAAYLIFLIGGGIAHSIGYPYFPWQTQTAWQLSGLLLPTFCVAFALIRARFKPVSAFSSCTCILASVAVFGFSAFTCATILLAKALSGC